MICICCGKSKHEVDRMMQINDEHFLCNQCTADINALFAKNISEVEYEEHEPFVNKILPKQIKEFLDEYVIGQDDAKKVLAVEIYNHYKRISHPEQEIEKSNILMIGDSGTGKTLLAKTMAKMLDLPFAICDCNALTQAGYVGEDVESVLEQLVAAAGGDIEKAETGIILLDEVDKIAKRNISSSTEKDASGEGVQAALLKIIEGHTVSIAVEGLKRNQKSEIDTSNILFICAGAFFGLEKILQKNHAAEGSGIGFNASVEKPDMSKITEVDEQDIIDFGFLPEFVGRLPVIVQLQKLSKEDFRRILVEPKNSIVKQYQNLMAIDSIDLEFTPEFLDGIVDKVYNTKRGARALRSELEKHLRDATYNLNDDSYGKTIKL
jgi:ATP-dependent Clp protease ATP-binding subunit ClpX